MIHVLQLTLDHDLAFWATAIEQAQWDEDNAIEAPYTGESLARYLADPTNVMIVAHRDERLLGMASATVRRKPYGDALWLYVDEVDVAVPWRRRGVGKALMHALSAIGREARCEELWLGTEADNVAAIALYRSVEAVEEAVLGYTLVCQR